MRIDTLQPSPKGSASPRPFADLSSQSMYSHGTSELNANGINHLRRLQTRRCELAPY